MNSHQHTTAGRRLIPSSAFKARLGGISEMSRWRYEKARIGPAPIKLNGRNFYVEDEVDAYLNQLATSRQHTPDDKSADAADDENLCLAERTAAQ